MSATNRSHPAASNLKHSVKLLPEMSLASYNFIHWLQTVCAADVFLGNVAGKSNFYNSNPIFKSLGCLLFKGSTFKSLDRGSPIKESLSVDFMSVLIFKFSVLKAGDALLHKDLMYICS